MTTDNVQVAKPHGTALTILSYLPFIMQALQAGFTIHANASHQSVVRTVLDGIDAGAQIGMEIPDAHVQLVAQIAQTIAPQIGEMVAGAKRDRINDLPIVSGPVLDRPQS